VPREADIRKFEQHGSEACQRLPNSSFVLVGVPVRVVGEGAMGEATWHYSIGSFVGRDNTLVLHADLQTTLRFRIPLELFRPRERLALEIFASGSAGPQAVLWVKRWEIAWQGKAPALEPMAD
jgi:hypothetical protein